MINGKYKYSPLKKRSKMRHKQKELKVESRKLKVTFTPFYFFTPKLYILSNFINFQTL